MSSLLSEEIGGQVAEEMVDFIPPVSQKRHSNAITSSETNNNNNGMTNSEATADGVEGSRPISHASEERRRDLYRL